MIKDTQDLILGTDISSKTINFQHNVLSSLKSSYMSACQMDVFQSIIIDAEMLLKLGGL